MRLKKDPKKITLSIPQTNIIEINLDSDKNIVSRDSGVAVCRKRLIVQADHSSSQSAIELKTSAIVRNETQRTCEQFAFTQTK